MPRLHLRITQMSCPIGLRHRHPSFKHVHEPWTIKNKFGKHQLEWHCAESDTLCVNIIEGGYTCKPSQHFAIWHTLKVLNTRGWAKCRYNAMGCCICYQMACQLAKWCVWSPWAQSFACITTQLHATRHTYTLSRCSITGCVLNEDIYDVNWTTIRHTGYHS